ncbi:DeoR/GlpR family DNA-binding transcription regulator [Paenibacillus sp. sptzw28]|uniref:DeoR/GlpR family DNA-binding transcription regulator n=1 Tax=Paenibacillus sp. sptzw28 TaxID=715179 RepID=UPI001C6DFF5C|nr:DeoR/GlpR family DNA-binding transcription regulator [Paenibacillus sp. sptzw28]QYR21787.1 DeoR/GlpR family DNA-binding transcription regulator [Paenibacillus sp. sptzw28]
MDERHQKILEILDEEKSVDIHYLKQVLAVSEPTIRNDLRFLESENKLQRIHGGAIQLPKTKEVSYSQRAVVRQSEKERIGRAAREFIQKGETVFLDAGSTIMALAEQLPSGFEFNAVTAALHIALEAGKHPNVSVHLVGGMLRSSLQELIGPKAIQGIREVHAHKVFLSISGVDLAKGITENHVFSAEVKKAMVESADQVILLADSSKMGKVYFADVLPLTEVDVIITDSGISPEFHQSLLDMGVEVIIA